MSITLQGLTPRQYQIADLLWMCDSQAAVQTVIQAMPREFRRDAEVVHQLMIAAVMDQYEEVTEDVKDCINRCRG